MATRTARTWALLGLVILTVAISIACGNTVKIAGKSMEPTLAEGEVVSLNPDAFLTAGPARGDIVTYDYQGQLRVSRIVGLPSETITIENGAVFANGAKLEEPYLSQGTKTQSGTKSFTMPADGYFVMGDNRDHANDSRQIGPILRSHIKAKALK